MFEPSQQFLEGARKLGLTVDLKERASATSLEEAAAQLNIEPKDIVKSLLLKHKDGTYLFALVPGDRKVSWNKLRHAVGVNKLSMPDSETALAKTGYVSGTITPIGSSHPWPVYFDRNALGKTVYMGAGAPGYQSAVDADALVAALDAVVADISDPL